MMRSTPTRSPALALVAFLAACAAAPAVPAPTAMHGTAPRQQLLDIDDRSILEAMRAAAVPGLAVAYLRDCRVERVAAYGVATRTPRSR